MNSPGTVGPSFKVSSSNKMPSSVTQEKGRFAHRLVGESIRSHPVKRVSTDHHSSSAVKSRNILTTTDIGNDGVLGELYPLLSRYITGQITDNRDYQQLLLSRVIGADEFFKKTDCDLSVFSSTQLKRAIHSVDDFFSLIPDELKTEELWQMAVDSNAYHLEKMPDIFKTELICKKAVSRNLDVLPFTTDAFKEKYQDYRKQYLDDNSSEIRLNILPKSSLTYQQCYDAVFPKAGAFSISNWHDFPDAFKDAPICKLACQQDGSSLEDVPRHYITNDLCRIALSSDHHAFTVVPQNMITEAMCKIYFEHTSVLTDIPYHLRAKEYCKKIIQMKHIAQFIYIPKDYTTKETYELFIDGLKLSSRRRLFEKMPAEFFEGLLDYLIPRWEKNPKLFGNEKLKDVVSRICNNKALVTRKFHGIKNYRRLFEIIKEKSRTVPVNESYSILRYCIAIPALDPDFKLDFLQWFNPLVSNVSPHLRVSNRVTLINRHNPLERLITNECLEELVELSFKACRFRPPEKEQGLALDKFIEDGLGKHPDFEYPRQQPDFDSVSTVCHGRTLIVTEARGTFYYKLQRKGEDPSQLTRESLIHQYLANGKASGLGLKSEIPTAVGLFRLPVNTIPPGLLQQLESLEIHPQGKSAEVLCYCYTLSLNYSAYTWQADVNSLDPYLKPETGMITACHDLGRWCAMGILHTSTLPAFHDTDRGRRWAPLQSALGKIVEKEMAMCGTFGAWDTTATERPDFRYSGLADLVDYELFGSVESYFLFKDLNALHSPPGALQRLAFANCIIEVLLANILLYARLHKQTDSDYCIEKQGSVDRLAQFIEAVAESFLAGFTQSYQNAPTLREALNQSENSYQQWLQRTATEIIYWTSERGQNFAWDLGPNGPGHLDLKLYPEPSKREKKYPESFHNCHGKLNLGAKNCSFPLLSLIQGLTKLCSATLDR